MVALLFTILSAVSVVIVAWVVINMYKRRREAQEEQRCKAEQEAKRRAEERERQRFEETGLKVEEDRKRLEEEAQQKAKEQGTQHKVQEEEQKRKTGKGARERNEREELKRQKAKEKAREVEEQHKRVEKEAQKKTEKVRGKKREPPVKRGGKPRGPANQQEREERSPTKTRSLKPEVVCWKEGWSWIIGMEVPEKLKVLSVTQNDELLEQDNIDEPHYRLKHAEGTLKIVWEEGEKHIPLVGKERNYLVFKMRKNWKERGRLVRCSTTGHYLIIVPQQWKRDEEVSGPAPVEPENVQLNGYKAHFFYQEQDMNTGIGFITTNGERIRIESGSPRFQLVGREIGDASENMGSLFGEQPPCIRALHEQDWSDVGVIVVGEEGSGRNRWRIQFPPHVDAKQLKLPEEIANRRGGWYFVRIYDNDDNLLESMDFRFLIAFKDICMERSDCLPGPNGYDNVTVQFLHQADCGFEPNDKGIEALEIRQENGQTIVTVPPRPEYDKTLWCVRSDGVEVEVTVLVERIWWAIGVMGMSPTNWVDKPIILSREDFTATSDKALFVRLPRPRWVRKIEVGFDRAKRRPYQVEVEKKEIAIPLRDFCDTREIENRQEESRIMIWVQAEGPKLDEAVIAKVPAEQAIPIQKQWVACGRKKTAVAYAVLRQGSGEFIVNDEPVWLYFKGAPKKARRFLRWLLELRDVKPLIEEIGIDAKVVGSQPRTNRQIKAVTHAVARALVCYDPRLKRLLREKGFGGVRVTSFFARRKQFTGE